MCTKANYPAEWPSWAFSWVFHAQAIWCGEILMFRETVTFQNNFQWLPHFCEWRSWEICGCMSESLSDQRNKRGAFHLKPDAHSNCFHRAQSCWMLRALNSHWAKSSADANQCSFTGFIGCMLIYNSWTSGLFSIRCSVTLFRKWLYVRRQYLCQPRERLRLNVSFSS